MQSPVVAFMPCGEYLLSCHRRALPLGSPPPEVLDCLLTLCALESMSGDQMGDCLAVACDDNRFTMFHGAQEFGESGLGLG